MNKLAKVIIIGRANVGKSTLFNRLISKQKALVSPEPGTTRDININNVYWNGVNFQLLDTGGVETITSSQKLKNLSPQVNRNFAVDIIKKTQASLKQADLILFVVDVQAGLLTEDRELAKALRKVKKEIILVANKTDSLKFRDRNAEFYKLGLGEPHIVSGLNGMGTGDLLDVIVKKLEKAKKGKQAEMAEIENPLKITIIGKPNAGKSSLLNAILGEERVIVSPVPFTTREAIDTDFQYKGQNIILVDTAGIRKQAKILPGLEKTSVRKSLGNAKDADICLLVIDISKPLTVQDNKLSKILIDSKVSIIIVANKWDLIADNTEEGKKKFLHYIYSIFPYLMWAPVIFLSAKTHKNAHNVLDLALQVKKARDIVIEQDKLDEFLTKAIKRRMPQKAKGKKFPHIHKLTQIKSDPPIFAVSLGPRDNLSEPYLKYLANSLRQHFNILGTPLKIVIKQ